MSEQPRSSTNTEKVILAPYESRDTSSSSPEHQPKTREKLKVTLLNTSFSEALDHPESLDELLKTEPGEAAIFGLSEVVRDQRQKAAEELGARGYEVVFPPDESYVDLVWAVGPGLHIEDTDVHHFPRKGIRRIASRKGSKGYRHVGMQDLTVITPGNNRIRLGQQRLSPWIIEPVRRKQLQDMEDVLTEHYPPDEATILTINGGDMNHIGPFRKPDDRLWEHAKEQEGWEPVLEKGTPTHESAGKYSRSQRVFRMLGRRSAQTQLDAAYARPSKGMNLVKEASPDVELGTNEIGFWTRTKPVKGTDHYAVETVYSLPANLPGKESS